MNKEQACVKPTLIIRSKLSVAYLRRKETNRAEQSLDAKVKK
jgi:hypothetical protein